MPTIGFREPPRPERRKELLLITTGGSSPEETLEPLGNLWRLHATIAGQRVRFPQRREPANAHRRGFAGVAEPALDARQLPVRADETVREVRTA
jgi:hypothetical protein